MYRRTSVMPIVAVSTAMFAVLSLTTVPANAQPTEPPAPTQPPAGSVFYRPIEGAAGPKAAQPDRLHTMASGPRKPPSTPDSDDGSAQECWNGEGAISEAGRVHNRFVWCQRGRIGGEVRNKRGRVIGRATFVFRAVGYGRDDGDRSTRIFFRAEKDTVDFDGNASELRVARLHLWAECTDFLNGCSSGGATAGTTFYEWDKDESWHSWTVSSSDTNGGEGPDLVRKHDWGFKVRVFSVEAPDVGPMFLKSHKIRCDSASVGFAKSRSKACIFDDVIPHLQYSTNSAKHKEVAQHIKCALDPGCQTWPTKAGKSVPGKYTGNKNDPGIHRITDAVPVDPSDGKTYYSKNSYQKTQACNRGAPYYADGLPSHLYDTSTQQCDEFPFASTKEGAGVGDWNFSVLGVKSKDNSCAGNALRWWYRDDRILVWRPNLPGNAEDKFFVEITDKPDNSNDDCLPPDDGPEPNSPPTANAGPDVTGDEGDTLALAGSASDPEGIPAVHWTVSRGPGTDEGSACWFTDSQSPNTTVTCNDDGTFYVTLTANDGVNGSVSDTATLTVRNVPPQVRRHGPRAATAGADPPPDNGIEAPRKWQLYRVGDPVSVVAKFSDPGTNDTHTCDLAWDDGSTESIVTYGRTCEATHTYTRAGMYTIRPTITDDDAGVDADSVLVIVYDPAAGVGRGNGWLAAPGHEGFDFTSSYPTLAATVPDGAVTFALPPAANLNLRNHQRLEWLVVTHDNKIAIKGTAERIPGQDVGFVLYGYVGQSGRPHQLRMVVWDSTAHGPIPEGVPAIYDNRAGKSFDLDEADPQPIAQGVIQIQHPPIE